MLVTVVVPDPSGSAVVYENVFFCWIGVADLRGERDAIDGLGEIIPGAGEGDPMPSAFGIPAPLTA
jgi:hypothetical protein